MILNWVQDTSADFQTPVELVFQSCVFRIIFMLDELIFVNTHVYLESLELYFSSFLMLRPFQIVIHIVGTPIIKLFLLLLQNYNFAIAMNHDVNIWYAGYVNPKEVATHRLRTADLEGQNQQDDWCVCVIY